MEIALGQEYQKKILEILGLVFEFLSVVLITPELIGESNLLAIERWTEKFFAGTLPITLVLGYAAAFLLLILISIVYGALPWMRTPFVTLTLQILGGLVWFVLIAITITSYFLEPLARKLASQSRTRLQFLKAGGVMFVLSFIVRLVSTLLY